MKIKALVNCFYNGNEKLNKGEIAEVSQETAKTLVNFGYAEALEQFKEEKIENLEEKTYDELKEIAKKLEINPFGVSKENLIEKIKEKMV